MAKQFAWSYSRVKSFEACPKKYEQVTILKKYSDNTEASLFGDAVHKAIAKYIELGTALPVGMDAYRRQVDEATVNATDSEPRDELIEQQFAITKGGKRCGWFGDEVWFRAIVDYLGFSQGRRRAAVVDWKTGSAKEDDIQLSVNALVVFICFPRVETITSQFVWLKEKWASSITVDRAECARILGLIYPRVQALEHAHSVGEFPPRPSGLCRRWCPVHTCPHHGG
jgi:hypothetical protein